MNHEYIDINMGTNINVILGKKGDKITLRGLGLVATLMWKGENGHPKMKGEKPFVKI